MKSYIEMGAYYRHQDTLVKTVCAMTHADTKEKLIGYVEVSKGGLASDLYVMSELKFKELYM